MTRNITAMHQVRKLLEFPFIHSGMKTNTALGVKFHIICEFMMKERFRQALTFPSLAVLSPVGC